MGCGFQTPAAPTGEAREARYYTNEQNQLVGQRSKPFISGHGARLLTPQCNKDSMVTMAIFDVTVYRLTDVYLN